MAQKNLHAKPFDEVTITKLEIFEAYAQAWIPTFVMSNQSKILCIFDFFAGTGYDKKRVPGSPIRILNKIKEYSEEMVKKDVKIKIFLNEFNDNKFQLLKVACESYINSNLGLKKVISISYFNEDFDICFNNLLNEIKKYPSLVYLDQNGIKFLDFKYLGKLEQTQKTDFLYFVSSSYFRRFGETEGFKQLLDIKSIKENPYKLIHKDLLELIKKKLPNDTKLRLQPFSLKKGNNIHGIIFGASHIRAVDKFLNIAWNKDKLSGEANFDINDDRKKEELPLLPFMSESPLALTKKELFENNLTKLILEKKLTTNKEVFDFTSESGHIGSHAANVLKKLKREGKISYQGTSPLTTYDNVYKFEKIISYTLTKNE